MNYSGQNQNGSCQQNSCGAANLNICIDQGADFSLLLEFNDSNTPPNPVDISMWTFTGQIRPTYDSSTEIAAFTFMMGSQTNQVYIQLSNTVTTAIPVNPSNPNQPLLRPPTQYVYDVDAVQGNGVKIRVLQGIVNVSPEVTRP